MFSLITGFYDSYFSIPTYRVLIIGDEKSGKTVKQSFIKIKFYKIFYGYIKTYFEHLKLKFTGRGTPLNSIIPTTGLNRN